MTNCLSILCSFIASTPYIEKTNIKPRHDVIYVDKFCIQDTYLSIRWWSVMWHDSQSCYRVLSIRIKDWSHSELFPLAFTVTASISLGENIFPSLRSLIGIFRIDIYAMFFRLPAWGAFFAPPLLKMII